MQLEAQAERHQLRQEARAARKHLSGAEHQQRSAAISAAVLAAPGIAAAQRIGAYHSVASEVATSELLAALIARGQAVFLPHLQHPDGSMRFARYQGDPRRLVPNRFGIMEPLVEVDSLLAVGDLDVLLLPLLAVDSAGHRLGSGAGYYDRALSAKLGKPASKPQLIGLAFACQQVPRIPSADWDVPLDALVTEAGWQHWERA